MERGGEFMEVGREITSGTKMEEVLHCIEGDITAFIRIVFREDFAELRRKDDADKYSDLTLNSTSFLLKTDRINVLGKSSSIVYAIALLASGPSSAITGTYAGPGQYIMQGFLDIKMRKWLRIKPNDSVYRHYIPSLIVSIIVGSSGAGRLIIIASMILSFELSFALIPLLKFSSSKTDADDTIRQRSIWISQIQGFCDGLMFGSVD